MFIFVLFTIFLPLSQSLLDEEWFWPVEESENVGRSFTDEELTSAVHVRLQQINGEASSEFGAISSRIDSIASSSAFEGDIQRSSALSRHVSSTREQSADEASGSGIQSAQLNFNAAIIDETAKWPGAQIPYGLSDKFRPAARQTIATAIAEFHMHTCVKFVPANSSSANYIYFAAFGGGCSADVGRIGGRQNVTLATAECFQDGPGIIIHELMHAIGFFHEQARYDRNEYVEIRWENIQPQMDKNFERYNTFDAALYQTYYDYHSIMHYDSMAFSKNGEPTIVPKLQDVVIGQRKKLSETDIYEIRRHYSCPGPLNLPIPEYGSTAEDCNRLNRCLSNWIGAYSKCYDEKQTHRDKNVLNMDVCEILSVEEELAALRWDLSQKTALANCIKEQSFDCAVLLPPTKTQFTTPFATGEEAAVDQTCGYTEKFSAANGDCSNFVGKCTARFQFCGTCYERSPMIETRLQSETKTREVNQLVCSRVNPTTTAPVMYAQDETSMFADPVFPFSADYRLDRCLTSWNNGSWGSGQHCFDSVVPDAFCQINGFSQAVSWTDTRTSTTQRLMDIDTYCPEDCMGFASITCYPYGDGVRRIWGEWSPWSICETAQTASKRQRKCLLSNGECEGQKQESKPCSADSEIIDVSTTNGETTTSKQDEPVFAKPLYPFNDEYRLDRCMSSWYNGSWGHGQHCFDDVVPNTFCRIHGFTHAKSWSASLADNTMRLMDINAYCPDDCQAFAEIACAPRLANETQSWGEWAPWSICIPEEGIRLRHRLCLFSAGCSGLSQEARSCDDEVASITVDAVPSESAELASFDSEYLARANQLCANYTCGNDTETDTVVKLFTQPRNPLEPRFLLDVCMFYARQCDRSVPDSFCRILGFDYAFDWETMDAENTITLAETQYICPGNCHAFSKLYCIQHKTGHLHSCQTLNDSPISWMENNISNHTTVSRCLESCKEHHFAALHSRENSGIYNQSTCLCGVNGSQSESDTGASTDTPIHQCIQFPCERDENSPCGSSSNNIAVYVRKDMNLLGPTYGQWSEWSPCSSENGRRERRRLCLTLCDAVDNSQMHVDAC